MLTNFVKIILVLVGFGLGFNSYHSSYGQATTIGNAVVRITPKLLPKVLAVSEKEIDDLAKLAIKPGALGGAVGKMKLDEAARADVFLRVAIRNGVIKQSDEIPVRSMTDTKGLASLLSKINSSNVNQAKGHLKELEIGLESQKRGGKVLAFGTKFDDGIKQGDTDLDVLLKINGKNFAVESKAYTNQVPTDTVRADCDSLLFFCKNIEKNAKPVFCFDTEPREIVKQVLKSKNIPYLTGTGEEICSKLDLLLAR